MVMWVELEGTVDDQGRLVLDGPVPLAPGRVRVRVDATPVESADDEESWRALVQHGWADSLNNPAEDCYSLDDGWPIDPETGIALDGPH